MSTTPHPPTPNPSAASQPRRWGPIISRAVLVSGRVLVIAAILAATGFFAWMMIRTKPAPPRDAQGEPNLTVKAITTQEVNAPRSWEGFGTARAVRDADLSAELAAAIVERPPRIEEGTFLAQGELIFRLDRRDFEEAANRSQLLVNQLTADLEALGIEERSSQSQAERAQKNVELYESELEQLRRAVEQSGASEVELARLERQLNSSILERDRIQEQLALIPTRRQRTLAELDRARSDLRIAQINLERTEIRAPFDGVLQRVEGEVGERVAPGEIVARIVDLATIEVPVRIAMSASREVAIGDHALLQLPDANVATTGTIERIAPEADVRTRTIELFVIHKQSAQQPTLQPGQFVRGTVRSNRQTRYIAVPRRSVDADRVFIAEPDHEGVLRAHPRDVVISHYVNDRFPEILPGETQWAVLASGLEPGDRVLINRPEGLLANTRVQTTEASAQEPGSRAVSDNTPAAARGEGTPQ